MVLQSKKEKKNAKKSFPLKLGVAAYELVESHEQKLIKAASELGENKPKKREIINYMFKKAPAIDLEEYFAEGADRKVTIGFSTSVHLSAANHQLIRSTMSRTEHYAIMNNKSIPTLISVYNYLLQQVTEIDPKEFF